ncbi:MAG: seg [Candidatus Taylorbacteria bacterium]|nr:seg [Candidatus Taylorbacteria bacterium]
MKRNLRTIAIIIFFLLFVLYAGFETLKLFLGPSLVIDNPKDLSTVTDPSVTVSGKVKRVSYITLNDRQIFADTEGHFEDKLLLLPGYNIIEIAVRDRFNKEVDKTLKIWYSNTASTTVK